MPQGFMLTQTASVNCRRNTVKCRAERTWWGGCPGWCSRSWGSLVEAAPLCMSHCRTCGRDTETSVSTFQSTKMLANEEFSLWVKEGNHSPVLHRTNVVIHHSHGIPVGRSTHQLQRGITGVRRLLLKKQSVVSALKLLKWTSWSFFYVSSELFSLPCSWLEKNNDNFFCLTGFTHNQRNNKTYFDFVSNGVNM